MADDWQQRVLERMRKPEGTRGPKRSSRVKLHDQYRTTVNLTSVMGGLLLRVCRQRDINRTGYVRRVLAVHIAAELDMPITAVLRGTPTPVRLNERRFWVDSFPQDDLTGIETYCPHPGCDGRHLTGRAGVP